jgi:hypothetical protein
MAWAATARSFWRAQRLLFRVAARTCAGGPALRDDAHLPCSIP